MKIVYKPETGKRRFDPETGQAVEPVTTHYLEIDGHHGGLISDNRDAFDPVKVARLIEAAPDLLSSCKEMLKLLRYVGEVQDSNPDQTSDHGRWLSAIARAEGKS